MQRVRAYVESHDGVPFHQGDPGWWDRNKRRGGHQAIFIEGKHT
jgi:hypothetical protein